MPQIHKGKMKFMKKAATLTVDLSKSGNKDSQSTKPLALAV